MLIILFQIIALLAVLIIPLFFQIKKKSRPIKFPKGYNDTSEANYAINENGYLEEIHNDRLSSHAH
jgi:hypothetical protein